MCFQKVYNGFLRQAVFFFRSASMTELIREHLLHHDVCMYVLCFSVELCTLKLSFLFSFFFIFVFFFLLGKKEKEKKEKENSSV